MTPPVPCHGALPSHERFPHSPITRRPHWRWPNGAGLAVYIGFNLELFAFGEGLGANIGPAPPTGCAELFLARIWQPLRRLALPGAV